MQLYRESYGHMLSLLTANNHLQVLKFDTVQESLDSVVDQLLTEFDSKEMAPEMSVEQIQGRFLA